MKTYAMTIIAAAAVVAMPGCGRSSQPQRRSTPAASSAAATPEEVARSAPYRMSGAALMATPSKVAAALRGAGYGLSGNMYDTATTDSFEDRVKERVTGGAVPHPTQVPDHETWRKDRESIRVQYGLYPGGPRAVSYRWSSEDPSPTDAEIFATLEKRYGPGWNRRPALPKEWCSPMPCSPASAILTPGHRAIDLMAPVAMYDGLANGRRVEAAAQAHQGGRQGSF